MTERRRRADSGAVAPVRRPRVLVAIDGSDGSDVAMQLAASLAWPPGSTLLVLTAVHAVPRVAGEPLPVTPADAAQIERTVRDEAQRAGRTPPRVRRLLVEGRTERVIVDAARRMRVNLIVLGSRGHGGVTTTLLGSVAAEVVDRSDRPVLVARSPRVGRIVLADDGSACAEQVSEWLLRWPLFRDADVRVVSVAAAAVAGTREGEVGGASEAHAQAGRVADTRRQRLEAAGFAAEAEVLTGDAADQILHAANDWADLILIGCRGRTGLRRLLLGSVARRVMTDAECSVLIVKERQCC